MADAPQDADDDAESSTSEGWYGHGTSNADWSTESDIDILNVLMSELTLTPSVIAENADLSRVTVNNRLNVLQARGMVEKVERGKYEITRRGAFFLTGNTELIE